MNFNDVKSRLSIGLFRLASQFPLTALRKAGRVLAHILFLFQTTARGTMEKNLQACFPELSSQQRGELARHSMEHYLQAILEIGAIWCWPLSERKKLITRVSGRELLDQALAKQRGVIVLTPHLGNWEVVGDYLAESCSLTVLYAPSKLIHLDKFIYRARIRGGYRLAPTEISGVKTLLKALKNNELVGILPDQVPEPESGVFAPFFGQPALTMTLVSNLINKTGAEVVCIFAKRLADREGFEICIRRAAANIDSNDKAAAAAALNKTVESSVLECPEQYTWGYKRFRKRPAGQPKLY